MSKLVPESVRVEQINSLEGVSFVRWESSYKNNLSRALVKCSRCDYEWLSTSGNLISHGKRCPSCARRRKYSEEEYINRVNDVPGVNFVNWESHFKNAHSKAICKCEHGHEWVTSLNCILHSGTKCPTCAGNVRIPEQQRIDEINSIEGITFIGWVDEYKNTSTKVIMVCSKGHVWNSTIGSVLHQNTRCPNCAIAGFRPDMPGTLYALISECGEYMKVGISNKYNTRARCLRSATPFKFKLWKKATFDKGKYAQEREYEIHNLFPNAGLTGFDGCTEWLVNSTELQNYLINVMKG